MTMRIFEKGLENFPDEVEFALRYLGFLISINDESSESHQTSNDACYLCVLIVARTDARALFERVVNLFPADRARSIWDRWARYEYQFGSLEASLALEKRISEVFPNGPLYSFQPPALA